MTFTLCDDRILLVPATLAMLKTELNPNTPVFELLNVDEPPYWPPDLNDEGSYRFFLNLLETDGENYGWSFFYAFDISCGRKLVGNGGYIGKPDAEGSVEIGYSVLQPYQRKGIATAVCRLLIKKAFSDERVKKVRATTLPDFIPSIGVLKKLGFKQTASNEAFTAFTLKRS